MQEKLEKYFFETGKRNPEYSILAQWGQHLFEKDACAQTYFPRSYFHMTADRTRWPIKPKCAILSNWQFRSV